MPFLGVLPERRQLFEPEPVTDIGVSDAEAWRLNPAHRGVYDKLAVALGQGLRAAPCGVAPGAMGIAADQAVFVKPITNLAGMSLGARSEPADRVPAEPGSFWCELLHGPQSSTDCLVGDGSVLWRTHTLAAAEKNRNRPLWWQVGVASSDIGTGTGTGTGTGIGTDAAVEAWVGRHLAGYTGLCNLELIGDTVIEAHLRGSNGFFEFYGRAFFEAWVALVDRAQWQDPGPIPGGCVVSAFGSYALPPDSDRIAQQLGVSISADPYTPDRVAIIRGPALGPALAALARLKARG